MSEKYKFLDEKKTKISYNKTKGKSLPALRIPVTQRSFKYKVEKENKLSQEIGPVSPNLAGSIEKRMTGDGSRSSKVDLFTDLNILNILDVGRSDGCIVTISASKIPNDMETSLITGYMSEFLRNYLYDSFSVVYFYVGTTLSLSSIFSQFECIMEVGKQSKNKLKNLYVVHPDVLFLAAFPLRYLFNSREKERIILISKLSELSCHMDLSAIYIPENVADYNETLENGALRLLMEEKTKNTWFGIDLKDLKPEHIVEGIPRIVSFLCNYIENKGAKILGIMRIPASKLEILNAAEGLDEECNLSLSSPFLASSLLSKFFRDLKQPVFTFDSWIVATKLNGLNDTDVKTQVQLSLKKLPAINLNILTRLKNMILLLAKNEKKNNMSISNLCICIGPSLLWPKNNIDLKIEHIMAPSLFLEAYINI